MNLFHGLLIRVDDIGLPTPSWTMSECTFSDEKCSSTTAFMLLSRSKNNALFYFHFFTFFQRRVHNSGLLSWNCFKTWNLIGLYKKNTTSSLKFSIKWNFTVYSAFLESKPENSTSFIKKKETVTIKDLAVITRWDFFLGTWWNFPI